MDSWTPAQMEIMKLGGNQKCQSYLKEKGNIAQNVPIKQKYESDVAQLYKLILKARAEGKFLLWWYNVFIVWFLDFHDKKMYMTKCHTPTPSNLSLSH